MTIVSRATTTSGTRQTDLSLDTTGLLAVFEGANALEWSDVHVARRLARMTGETRESVQLAAALAVWAARAGSVCVDLVTVSEESFEADEVSVDTAELPWPSPAEWVSALSDSPMVGCEPAGPRRPLRLVGDRVYLDRFWREEEVVRESLQRRMAQPVPLVDEQRLDRALTVLFPDSGIDGQRQACRSAARSWVSVIAGGPGTGKTTTIGRLLLVLRDLGLRRVALAAPTGKAAVRLGEAVRSEFARNGAADLTTGIEAITIHRLLGLRPGGGPGTVDLLPHDVIVVDEMSMVSLPLMARLLSAVGPESRLVLVGDPDQLASVDAGAVLADLTESSAADRLGVVRLTENFRFGSEIATVAEAIRSGDSDAALDALRTGTTVRLAETDLHTLPVELHDRVVDVGSRLHAAAIDGDTDRALTVLDEHRVLCGHRTGPFGVATWNRIVHRWTSEAIPGYAVDSDWYPGRPILITENSVELGLFNGDTGVVLATPMGLRAAFPGERLFPVHLLDAVVTAYAMTVHKAQGSQFGGVSLIVPPPGSPLLTRQLLYTAVTRAKSELTLYGKADAVAEAVRRPALRASGLRQRL